MQLPRQATFACLAWALGGCVAQSERRVAADVDATSADDTSPAPLDGADGTEMDAVGDGDAGADGASLRRYPPSSNPAVLTLRALAVADLDGDGAEDLVVSNALETTTRGVFVFPGRRGFDVDAFGSYLRTSARALDLTPAFADGDDRLDLVTVGRDRIAGVLGLLEVHLARGAPLEFAAPLLFQWELEGFPDGGGTLPDAPPVRVIARDVTRDDVVDFVVADTTRIAFLSPTCFEPVAFAQSVATPLSLSSPMTGIVDVHFVPARGAIDDRIVVFGRERLSIFEVPFTPGVPPSPVVTGALPFADADADRIGSATADTDGDGLRELLVYAGDSLHAVTLEAVPTITTMDLDSFTLDNDFDALHVLDVNGNAAPDVVLLDSNALPNLGTSSLVLVLDLFTREDALESPIAPVSHKLERGFDPELIAAGDFDGEDDDLEIVVFDVDGAAACVRLNRSTFAMDACTDPAP